MVFVYFFSHTFAFHRIWSAWIRVHLREQHFGKYQWDWWLILWQIVALVNQLFNVFYLYQIYKPDEGLRNSFLFSLSILSLLAISTDLKKKKTFDFRSVLFFTIGMIIIKFLVIFLGLIMYATYEHCDPIRAGVVSRSDEVRITFEVFLYLFH